MKCGYNSCSLRSLKKLSVDVLAKLVFGGYQIGTGYTGCIDDARANVENWEKLKSELIESQRSEIRLQGKIIE